MLTAHSQSTLCPDADATAFYQNVMSALSGAGIPFLVGGAYALRCYTEIVRDTKDFDIFLRRCDVEPALELLAESSERAELTYPHWLGKVHEGDYVVDLIFSSGNGLCPVDDEWFEHGVPQVVLDMPVKLVPAEEMIWQKAFIMERHRFDGADVIHLLRSGSDWLDWDRLERRFGDNWLVLLGHLLLLKFAFPGHHSRGLKELLQKLTARLTDDVDHEAGPSSELGPTCQGTFLSLLDYLPAVQAWGYRDARLPPTGKMRAEDIDYWTNNFEK